MAREALVEHLRDGIPPAVRHRLRQERRLARYRRLVERLGGPRGGGTGSATHGWFWPVVMAGWSALAPALWACASLALIVAKYSPPALVRLYDPRSLEQLVQVLHPDRSVAAR
jgi:hypothetical protein